MAPICRQLLVRPPMTLFTMPMICYTQFIR